MKTSNRITAADLVAAGWVESKLLWVHDRFPQGCFFHDAARILKQRGTDEKGVMNYE